MTKNVLSTTPTSFHSTGLPKPLHHEEEGNQNARCNQAKPH